MCTDKEICTFSLNCLLINRIIAYSIRLLQTWGPVRHVSHVQPVQLIHSHLIIPAQLWDFTYNFPFSKWIWVLPLPPLFLLLLQILTDPIYFQLKFTYFHTALSCQLSPGAWGTTQHVPSHQPKFSILENHLQPFLPIISPGSKPAIFNCLISCQSETEGCQVVILHSSSPVVLNPLGFKTCGDVVLWKYLLNPKTGPFVGLHSQNC